MKTLEIKETPILIINFILYDVKYNIPVKSDKNPLSGNIIITYKHKMKEINIKINANKTLLEQLAKGHELRG